MERLKKFRKERLRLLRQRLNLEFLIVCKKHKITPKFLNINNKKLRTDFEDKVTYFERQILNRYIRRQYAVIMKLEIKCRNILEDLYKKLPNIIVDQFLIKLEVLKEMNAEKIEKRHLKKIENLMHKQPKVKERQQKKVEFINMTDKVLTQAETELLEKGPKYVIQKKPNFKNIIPQLEGILRGVCEQNRLEIRAKMACEMKEQILKNHHNDDSEKKILMKIKEDENIAILQTDKTNKIIIMKKTEYNDKLKESVDKLDCEKIKKNPIETIMKKVRELSKDKNWPQDLKDKLIINSTATIPILFGRVKDHKPNLPIRPIVAKCMAPTYAMEKVLKVVLNGVLPESENVITSTREFIIKVKGVKIEKNEKMVSLDVTSLYPSINTMNVENVIHTYLDSSGMGSDYIILIKRALALILRTNYIDFNGNILLQKTGAPMGSPLSGTLAEFKLRPLENDIITKMNQKIKLWTRYVDDVFVIWSDTNNIEEDIRNINDMDQDIKFTYEIEKNNVLNYLDVSLIRKGKNIIRDVFRKQMSTGCIIPNSSTAPLTYKLSAFRSMIYRMYIVCTRSRKEKEWRRILEIAHDYGFSKVKIEKLRKMIHRKINKRNQRDTNISNNDVKFAGSMEYVKGFTERIMNILKKENIRIGIKMNGKIMNIVKKDRPKPNMDEKKGVYRVPIIKKNGDITNYIGMTKRKMKIRRKEHERDIRNGAETTELARTCKSGDCKPLFNEMRIISQYTTKFQTLIRESLEIKYNNMEICNKETSYIVPAAWKQPLKLLLKQ